jgi:hypothetical protein
VAVLDGNGFQVLGQAREEVTQGITPVADCLTAEIELRLDTPSFFLFL